MVAAAVVGAAAIGTVGTVVASNTAADATQNAANTAAQSQQAAINEQQQALQQQLALAQPYTSLGQSAMPSLQALLGIGSGAPGQPGAPNGQQIQNALQNMPGFQFQQQQGNQAAINAATAQGMGLSGNTLEGLSRFNQGLASSNYQQYLGNLFNTVGIGQAAAAGQAANIGNTAAGVANSLGNIGNIAINQGNTMAGIQANEAAGLTKIAGNAGNQAMTLNALNNPNGQDIFNLNSNAQASPGAGGGTVDAGGGFTLSGFGGPQ